jgi:carboxymethylenebutenolidase
MPSLPFRALLPFALATTLAAQDRPAAPATEVPYDDALPPGTPAHVEQALAESPRHGEFVDVPLAGGGTLNCWVVHPERKDKAPVVLVIHDIRGLADWSRAVGDQLAQDGFLAVVPDFLSGKGPDGGGTSSLGKDVGQTIRKLTEEEVVARLDAAKAWALAQPATNGKVAVVGFCWGGSRSFGYALAQPQLAAAVVYYGDVPGATADSAPGERIAKVAAPVLGLYGGNDARINATLPPTIAAMLQHGKTYEFHCFEGAGHAFLHRHDGPGGFNLSASRQAWPLTLVFLRRHLER